MENKQVIFAPGDNGSKAYRIPTLLYAKTKDVLIAANDARIDSQRDNPNKINNVIRRSYDNGKTWTDIQTTISFPGEGLGGPAAIDSCLLEDEITGDIFIMYCHSPGGIGWFSSSIGTGFDEEGRKLLMDHLYHLYYIGKNGEVFRKDTNEQTVYRVDEIGYLSERNQKIGTIYEKFDESKLGLLFEASTCFLQIIKSSDGGITWSKPVELNPQVKANWMRFIGSGPGIGIQLKYGEKKGRLVYPIYYTNSQGIFSCAMIYSDDHGKNWHRGKSPNDARELMSQDCSSETLGQDVHRYELTENQVIELSNGDLVVYMRNHYGNGYVAKAISKDGGETFGDFTFDENLINPVCQFSILNYTHGEKVKEDMLVFFGPNSKTERELGTIKISEDGGKTWPYEKLIEPKDMMYSCLTRLKDGTIGILYEGEEENSGYVEAVYLSLSLEEVKKA